MTKTVIKPTTVGDLKEILAKLPEDMRVFVQGYEGGLDDPRIVGVVDVEPNTDVYGDLYGDYLVQEVSKRLIRFKSVKGLYIARPGR